MSVRTSLPPSSTPPPPRSSLAPRVELGVRVEDSGSVRTITLDRPSGRNALDLPMCRALTDALAHAASDEQVLVVRLTATGSPFSVGENGAAPAGDDAARELRAAAEAFFKLLAVFPKPIIAEVSGLAAGAAAAMLLLCDYIIATPTAMFEFPSARKGTLPSAGASVQLVARLGLQRATELAYFGERLSAEAAHQLGLVGAVVVREQLTESTLWHARALTELPQPVLRATKRLLREPLRAVLDDAIAREAAFGAEPPPPSDD